MNKGDRVVLLLSGGIDSSTLLFWLLARDYEVFPLHIDYGQVPFIGECRAITNILPEQLLGKNYELDISNVKSIGTGALVGEYPKGVYRTSEWFKGEFFPNRNMLLITIAAIYAFKVNIRNIAIGVTGQNSYGDTTRSFIYKITKLLRETLLEDITIIAPFAEKPRNEVVNEAIRLKVPIERTFSCNSLGDRHCLLCTSCIERESALKIINGHNS